MSNLRIIYPNYLDDATLSASPALVATLGVDNLKDPSRSLVARSTALQNPQHIRGNLSQLFHVSSMALVRHNLTAAATIRFRLWDDADQTGNNTYDSGVIALGDPLGWGDFGWGLEPWGGDAFRGWPVKFSALWFTAALAQSFELQITDLANTDGYYDASRLFVGSYWTPASNMEYGHTHQEVDPSAQERTAGGTLRTDAEESYRRWELDIAVMEQTDRAVLAQILREAGKRDDFFFCAFPDAFGAQLRDYAGQAKNVDTPPLAHEFATNWRTGSRLVLEEV